MTETMHEQRPFVWAPKFDTGVGDIDDQHHVLVNTLNEANLTLRHETSIPAIDRLLQDLLAYALYHFETEEHLMLEHDYEAHEPEAARQHIEDHRKFAQQVVTMRNTLGSTGDINGDALLSFLGSWLQQHILGVDQKLAAFLRERGAAG